MKMPSQQAKIKSARQERRREAAQNREQARRWKALARDRNKGMAAFNRDARWFPGGPASARLTVYRPKYMPTSWATILDDAEARWIAISVSRFVSECASYSPGEGFQCLCCETCFGDDITPDAIVLTAPVKSNATTIAIGVCVPCSGARSDAELVEACCRHLSPGMRITGKL